MTTRDNRSSYQRRYPSSRLEDYGQRRDERERNNRKKDETPWYNRLSTANKVAAIIIWLVGAVATMTNLQAMGMIPLNAKIGAFAAQAVFTIVEIYLWRGIEFHWAAIVVTFIDAFFNFGGVYPYASMLDKTPSWKAANDAMGTNQSLPLFIMTVCAIIISLLIAGAPEWLWRRDNR
jgi:hypothetical protein